MSHYGKHPSLKRDSEAIDSEVWHWFICNGPHGERFCWHKELSVAPRDIDYLRKFIDERNDVDPTFIEKARLIALEALENSDPILVCTGIQVLAVVGKDSDLESIKKLLDSQIETVAVNARCCLFERGIKIKKRKT